MDTTSRSVLAAAALTLSAAPLVLTTPAVADGPGSTKAGIEHAERQATGSGGQTKAQIEQRERQPVPPMTRAQLEERWRAQAESGGDFTGGGARQQPSPSIPAPTGDGGAAAWQLALSAALGAVMAGGVLVVAREVSHHRHPVASAH